MLSWQNSSSSTAYTCPSMKYINRRNCGRLSYATTILASVEILPFMFCFYDSSIIDPDPMYIIDPVYPFQSGCAAKDTSIHNLMTLRLSALSMSVRFRLRLMYLSTLTSFPQSSYTRILTRVHRKEMAILMYLLALDVKNSSCATMWWNAVARSSFSIVRSS